MMVEPPQAAVEKTPLSARPARQFAVIGFLALALFTLLVSPADANRKYASVVVAEETGEVLYARNSKSRRYPASLTKVMTLYLVFEDLSAGKVTLDSSFTASRYAANQPPSKLGIKKGQKIKVRDAIKALVVRSANDVAVVVAEGLAGSERKFAKRMTQRARSLGMSRTTFRNASGLPNRRQVTTASDLAVLGRAIARDFPQYFHFFSEKKFTWKGRTWRTHNHVLKHYNGADGIKTGYTRASGFNLITSAERNGARLIGVVLGGRTPKRRDRDMARILNLTFGRIKKNPGKYRHQLMAAVPKPVLFAESRPGTSRPAEPVRIAAAAPKVDLPISPAQKPALKPKHPVQVASVTPVERPDALDPTAPPATPALRTADAALQPKGLEGRIALALRETSLPADTKSARPADTTKAKLDRARRQVSTDSAIGAMTASLSQSDLAVGKRITLPLTAAATFTPDNETIGEGDGVPLHESGYGGLNTRGIQVGAFTQFVQANLHIQQAQRLAGSALPKGKAAIFPARTPSGQIYRVRFGPLSETETANACSALKAQGLDCFPIQDENWESAIRP